MTAILKVDTIQDTAGNNIINESSDTITIGAAGDTVTVPGTEVKSNKLSPASGTALQIGDSGDTITIPSGATIVNSGTQTGFGGTLVPAFSAFNASTQNISDATITKCRFNTEILDSSGKYDSSTNYRFTPASTGYYLINANVSLMSNSGADLMLDNYIWIYENNAQIAISQNYGNSSNRDSWGQHNLSCIVHSDNVNDYYEIFAYADMSSGSPEVAGHASRQFSSFNAFKLIL